MFTNFKTLNYRGCINLKTNDLYLTRLSPKYRLILNWKSLKYDEKDKGIDREIHEAIRKLQQNV